MKVFSLGHFIFFWRQKVKPIGCKSDVRLLVFFGRDGRLRRISPPPFLSSFLQNSVSECQVSLKYSGTYAFFRSPSTDNVRRIVAGGPEVPGRGFVVALVSSPVHPVPGLVLAFHVRCAEPPRLSV